jgi:hypothetical protein
MWRSFSGRRKQKTIGGMNMTALPLVDIQDIKIDQSLPVKDRVKSMVQQLKNPYHFKHKSVTVHINYVGRDSLEDKIVEIYRNT